MHLQLGKAVEEDSPELGYAKHYRDNGEVSVYARVTSAVDSSKMEQFVARHMLLHAAGLAHDDFPESAIYPLTAEDSTEDQMEAARITEHDIELLKRYRR